MAKTMAKTKAKTKKKSKKVVVIGGGTGTYVVLTGLKHFDDVSLAAVVNVTDSGGSTGRLRDEYGILPVGDIRQALVALADEGNGDNLLRDLFLYRFDKGDIRGHNFGNLFLTAMTDTLGSEDRAIRYASKVLNIKGTVVPIVTEDIELVAEYEDGSVLVGEKYIDDPGSRHDSTQRVTNLKVQPRVSISKRAEEAILDADYIVMGPGDLYSSLFSNLVVDGSKEVMKKSKAKLIYIVNLMTKVGQSPDYSAQDHVNEMEKYAGRVPDVVVINNTELPEEALKRYKEEEGADPVLDDLSEGKGYEIRREDLITDEMIKTSDADTVRRSLIRHNTKKVGSVVHEVITSL